MIGKLGTDTVFFHMFSKRKNGVCPQFLKGVSTKDLIKLRRQERRLEQQKYKKFYKTK